MKDVVKLFVVATLLINVAFAQVKWTVDPVHTNARFAVKHLGISMVDGQFKTLKGSMETKSPDSFDGASITFEIDVNSMDTRVEARDNHLKSADFFDASNFPKMTLNNAVLKKSNDGNYTLSGHLTIRNVTKPVVFSVVQHGDIITDPWGKTRAGFTAKTSINRFDFDLKYNDMLPTGVPTVAPEVEIVVNTELVKN
ncbi:YceI family protein [Sphingobacterium suaedae]|uniref:YceI family protein n=1 Tax=Sphingobacterium suaedae TaxID=1686402 RepID=A0ABW5KFE3_9SPHI